MKQIQVVMLLLSVAGLMACSVPNKPQNEAMTDSVFVESDIRFFGQHYPNIAQNIVSIDLLSKGLVYDSSYHISGTGTNVYLSDIFIPLADTLLPSGVYDIDTTVLSYTLLPGMRIDRTVTGAYLLRIKDGVIKETLSFNRGSMTVSQWADSVSLDMVFYTQDSSCYHGWYVGSFSYR